MLQKISKNATRLTVAAMLAVLPIVCQPNVMASKVTSKSPVKVEPSKSTSANGTVQPAHAKRPLTLTAEQRGQKVFKKSYCIGCHVNGNNAMSPDKPIKGEAFTEKYKDDTLLAKTIRKGFPDEGMPAFGNDQISDNQMKDLILYIRSLSSNK